MSLSRTREFIKHVQTKIVQDPVLSVKFNRNNIYRKDLPQIKDPVYPCITIYYDLDPRQAFAQIDRIQLYVTLHTDDFFDAEASAEQITDLFQRYSFANDSIVIYKMFSQGGMVSPIYDTTLRKWNSVIQFDVELG